MDLLFSSQTFMLLNTDGYIRSGACRCTEKVKVIILMLNHVWEKGGSCVVFECHFVYTYIYCIYIYIYIYIYILLRLWKFALHHKGPQVRYIDKFMCS